MLLLIDQPRNFKVVRVMADETGANKRERIGTIPKSTLEVAEDLKKQMSQAEVDELEGLVGAVREASVLKRRATAMALPESLREGLEFLASDANETERKLIVTAILEAVRAVRKMQRAESDDHADEEVPSR